jgi:hypothetical protein
VLIRQMNISHDMTRLRDRRDHRGSAFGRSRHGPEWPWRHSPGLKRNGYAPRLLTLQRLATALHVSVGALIVERPPRPRNT